MMFGNNVAVFNLYIDFIFMPSCQFQKPIVTLTSEMLDINKLSFSGKRGDALSTTMAPLFRLNAHDRFYQRAENLPASHGPPSYIRNVSISLLLACLRGFEQSTAQAIKALHAGLFAEEQALQIASLLSSLREVVLLKDICSHYRCLLTPLSVIIVLPFRYVSASVFSTSLGLLLPFTSTPRTKS